MESMDSRVNSQSFSVFDYVFFVLTLVVSAFIGFYYAWKERHKQTTNNLLLGNRKLKIFPVGMSILASFTSAVSILGFSREMYQFGSMYILMGFSYFITQPIAAHLFVPFYHRLRITSAYEYLEMRFNSVVSVIASSIFCLQMFFYMAVVLYSPSLAVNQVMGTSLWVSIFVTGLICTLYTALGGMKAVVLTDTFQVFVMFFGTMAIIIQGVIKVGGLQVIWDRANESGRIEMFDFSPTLLQRHTFWSLMIGGVFTSMTVYGSNQATIQRYLSVPTIRDGIIAMYINLFGTFLILLLTCLCGFIAFAYYFSCDPLKNGQITRYDQILPYLVMDLLKELPGLAGLFIACIYSAALSTISSGLNALTAVFLRDFIVPLYKHKTGLALKETTSTLLTKILAFIFGLMVVCLSFLCHYLGSTVLQISLSIFGILGGPLLGVITLGMFIPYANSYGATAGLVCSTALNLWLGIGSVLYGKMPQSKPFNSFCNDTTMPANYTMMTRNETRVVSNEPSSIYQLSYLWFSLLAILNTFLIGILVTFITKLIFKSSKIQPKLLDKNLYIDVAGRFRCLFKCSRKADHPFVAKLGDTAVMAKAKEGVLLNDTEF